MSVNCFQCKHFNTTWNPAFPRACKAYGFKSKEMPSTLVLKATGSECLQFEPKRYKESYKTTQKRTGIDYRL
ncbi:uracil-DNA glycosylase [Halobacillus yeomjeoni]|uniref:uracil-DNA glycosylase n=1 Tax=Halobacillus yeomjeoni TaxID=311194 RepID=UPI001CD45126|nr:uracil-DNA glycosylase [Halobacillus yeomjeoni]MCA0985418.1 uracil-DNA glycosylase [Halobacillus yeomjeoni]